MQRARPGALSSAMIAGLFALVAVSCGEEPVGISGGNELGARPQFHENPEPLIFITGGGRFDYPPGEPGGPKNKNTPESRDFETFGFRLGDRHDDGEIKGQVQYVDHREEQRINGRPLNIHSVSFRFFEARAEGACTEGGATAIGIFEIKNTGERLEGQVRVCDNGEPGNRRAGNASDPPDHFFISLVNGYEAQGYLTGGNIQAHF